MKGFLVSVALGALLAGTALAANAQETVQVGSIEATRVVIAPPKNALGLTIKQGLKAAYDAATPGTRAYEDAQKLYFFYGSRHFEPIWLQQDANGDVSYSAKADEIRAVFQDAYKTGLRPSDYLTADINLRKAGDAPQDLARLETAFSAAALRYAEDNYGGRINPLAVSKNITIAPHKLDETKTLMTLVSSDHPGAFLRGLEPKYREFQGLKAALAGYYDGTVQDSIVVPDGKLLRPGMTDDRIPLLRKRLELDANALAPNVYDQDTVAAVENFQESLGLQVDGVVGPATIAALNGGSAITKDDIIANMERWRWMPSDMGKFNVQVNIPEFRVAIHKDGETTYTTRVVVGKTNHQTPIFSDEIEHIVVNPYWNVPSSIAVNEIGPQVYSNPGYIASHNMELLSGGHIIDASAVDWSENSIRNFRVRQRPGASNALGSVKFLFPNSHNVYLHDTPSKYLFERSYRAFSHGCMRVQNPWDFAAALIKDEPGITLASLESQRGGSEKWNNLPVHIPVHITYFTLRVDEDGSIRSFGDVYGHNKKLIELMGLN